MKKLPFIVVCMFLNRLIAQNIGIGTNNPDPSARLQIHSTNSGLLVPRLTALQRTNIGNPANGLLVYETDSNSFWYYNGSNWIRINSSAGSWELNGNSGTDSLIHFIGTKDNLPIRFRLNNTWAGELNPVTGNYALGYKAMKSNVDGKGNIAIGTGALYSNTVQSGLVAIGDSALYSHIGDNSWEYYGKNTAVGEKALIKNDFGYQNTAIGSYTLRSNTKGAGNTAVGFSALENFIDGYDNTAVGKFALREIITGHENTAIGNYALQYNLGTRNTAAGAYALSSNTSGENNTASGVYALSGNTSGDHNTCVGFSSGSGSNGSYNTAIGVYNLSGSGNENTASGAFAMGVNTSGYQNTASGYKSLYANTEGFANVANGWSALYSNTTGIYNAAVGNNALYSNTIGNQNTAVGYAAFFSGINFGNSTALGYNTVITASNQIRLGNNLVTSIGGFAGWSNVSDGRFKKESKQITPGLSFIMKLRPVCYYLDMDAIADFLKTSNNDRMKNAEMEKSKQLQSGFIAQEVEKAAKDIGYDFSGLDVPKNKDDYYGLRYAEFVVPLVKAIQEQQVVINQQQKQIDEIMKMLSALTIAKTHDKQ